MPLSTPQRLSMFLNEEMAHVKSYNVSFDQYAPAFDIFHLFRLLGSAVIEEFFSRLQKYEEPFL